MRQVEQSGRQVRSIKFAQKRLGQGEKKEAEHVQLRRSEKEERKRRKNSSLRPEAPCFNSDLEKR